jgi:hypothetical protein
MALNRFNDLVMLLDSQFQVPLHVLGGGMAVKSLSQPGVVQLQAT